MKIGVFDSGIGGMRVMFAIAQALPEEQVVFRNDSQHVPYGNRSLDEIYTLITPILQELVNEGCQMIVIACNTVSTTLINKLRKQFNVPLIPVEPMVKPAAAATKTGVIAVCATPNTLASPRYQWLKQRYAQDTTVLEPDCSDWSYMIENNRDNELKLNTIIYPVLNAKADVIVLGCTHYHWIENEIKALVGSNAIVMQPEAAIVHNVKRVLARLS